MAGTFYIRIGAVELTVESRVEWALVEAAGLRSGSATLGEVAPLVSGHRLTLLVPNGEVVLLPVTLPTRRRQQLRAALPYLLEEQLAEDVERLQFALGPIGHDLSATAAVVARSTLEGWLAPFHALGLSPQVMCPEGLALATTPDQWTLLADGSEWLLATGQGQVSTAPMAAAAAMVAAGCETTAAPQRLRLCRPRGATGDTTAIEALCAERGITLEAVASHHHAIDYLLAPGAGQAAINLLQGEYSPSGQIGRRLRPWRLTAALAGALLLVEVGGAIAHYQGLKGEVARLEQGIEQRYRDTFPEARRVENPRAQMAQRLAALRGGGEDTLSRLLGRAAAPLAADPGVVIETLSYRQRQLELAVAVGGFEALDRLKQGLAKAGLQVEISGANAEAGRVRSQLRIREAGQ